VGTKVGEDTFTETDADVSVRSGKARGQDGTFLWHGLARGPDLSALAGTSGSPLIGKPFGIPLEWFQYFLLQDPKWDWTTLTPAGFELLWRQSVEQYGAVIGTDDPDLTHFRDRGGKVIIYHGLADNSSRPKARSITTSGFSNRWAGPRRRRSLRHCSWRRASITASVVPGPRPPD
jgi:Tannase and feruloyl esterase